MRVCQKKTRKEEVEKIMCELCKQFRCPSNCPNAPEREHDAICDRCGCKLYEGDRVLQIDEDLIWCEGCAEDCMKFL